MIDLGIKANGQWNQFYGIGTQLPVSVIVNNLDMARELGAVHRFTHIENVQDEGWNDWHKAKGAIGYARAVWTAHNGYGRIYLGNEPHTTDSQTRAMSQFFADAAKELIRLGATEVVVFNSPPAYFPAHLVNQGAFDPLIELAHEYPSKVLIGVHDYDDFNLVRHINDEKDYKQLGNRDYVQNWSTIIKPDSSWHLYHFTRLIERARLLGKRIRVAITELGWSEIRDDNTYLDTVRVWAQFPPSPIRTTDNEGRPILNGFNSLHGYWGAMYPQWTWDEVADRQLRHYLSLLDRFYPEVEWATVYAFGFGGAHGQELFNSPLVDRIIRINAPKQPVNAFISPLGDYNVNIRNKPQNGQIIGSVPAGGYIEVSYLALENGWHKFIWRGQTAYSSASFSKRTNSVSNPITVMAQYTYDTLKTNEVQTHQEIQRLISTLAK